MKGSRIAAVGIVAAATLWIASGHFLPHENAESKAAVRPADAPEKLFRVAIETASLVPHSQKLTLSGRTEADRKVMATARTGLSTLSWRIKSHPVPSGNPKSLRRRSNWNSHAKVSADLTSLAKRTSWPCDSRYSWSVSANST